MRLPGNRFVVEELDIDFIHTHNGRRMRIFAEKGVACVNCSRVGTRLVRTHVRNMRKDGRILSVHLDVYTDDWVMMTLDHILPRAKGGPDDKDNLQPMCAPCNQAKADKVPERGGVVYSCG